MGQEITLGRVVPGAQQPRMVDLTPYMAQEKGVSRQHAVLRAPPDGGLTIEDIGSSNGTALNRERLIPHTIHPVRSGDHIMVGALELEIYFEQAAATTGTGAFAREPEVRETRAFDGEEQPVALIETPKRPTATYYKGTVRLDPQQAASELEEVLAQVVKVFADRKDCTVRLTFQVEAGSSEGFDQETVRRVEAAAEALRFSDSSFRVS
jgi:predicted component of type VI protein secretion system